MVSSIIKGNQNTTKLIAELKKTANKYSTLSKEEESKMIEDNKHNREKLNDLLFMHNIRLVFSIAKKYMSKTDDFDSMVQDGMLGLAIAANNFDITRGVKFITYAMPWIKKKVLERFYIKENEITKRSVSLNAPTSSQKVNDGTDSSLEDWLSNAWSIILRTNLPLPKSLIILILSKISVADLTAGSLAVRLRSLSMRLKIAVSSSVE